MVSLSILWLTVLPLCLLYEQMTCSNLSVLLRNNLSKYCALNFFEQLLHQNISVSHTRSDKKNSWVHIEFRIMNIKAATELWSWRTCWVSTCRLQPQSTARWKIVHKYELCSKGGFNSVVKTGQEAKAHVKALQRHKLQKNKPIIASVRPKIASKH